MDKELPIGWIETKLGVIAEWGSGGTPNRSEPNFYNGTIPWVKTGDLNDSIILESSEYITELGLKKSSAKLFPKGSIIIAMYGATIGKTAKLGIDATTNQACAVAQASKIVVPEFLHYFLKAEKQDFIDKGKGGAQPNISQTVIKEHPFPLPPLPEQQRIVAKLDALFGQIDRIKTSMERIPQLLKDFRQKVLTQAVTGKLTEEWREGRELEECDLGYFCENSFYGPRFSSEEYSSKGYPTVRTTDMTDNGFILIGHNTPRVDIPDKKKLDLYKIKKGDLLITRTGSIGKMARYVGEEIAIPSAYLIRFRFNEKVLTDFIFYCLTSPYGQNQMGLSSTAITQPNLNAQKIKTLKVPNISIDEQQEIVHRVESLFAKADQIEASYQKLKEKIEQLPQALLAKAFRGELVEQLPTDGDARDLLEQIKQAKAGLEKSGKSKKLKVKDELRMVAEERVKYGREKI